MIHYHGGPITPVTSAVKAWTGRHAFVSFAYPEQLRVAMEVCQSWALDNGAFSAWKADKPVEWARFYEWVAWHKRIPGFDFAIIPDVIDGTEADNDALLAEWPHGNDGVPVWHLHESLERLQRLAFSWPRIAFGSSGEYQRPGSRAWWDRMAQAMNLITDREGRPVCKLHGLRMLDPDIFTRLPFSSADSTNVARNIGIDSVWKGTYPPHNKDVRALVMVERIESHNSAILWERQRVQERMFA